MNSELNEHFLENNFTPIDYADHFKPQSDKQVCLLELEEDSILDLKTNTSVEIKPEFSDTVAKRFLGEGFSIYLLTIVFGKNFTYITRVAK